MSKLFIKRIFDIVFSLFMLIMSLPLFVVIMLIIKIKTEGPVFYKSPRIGKNHHIFSCLKFRTMYIDADERLQALLTADPLQAQEWKTYQKLKDDPRIYPFGHFLRKTSLDEWPQFLNVLKGDLSLVGPRPFYQNQIDRYLGDKALKFLSVKPGLTGLWQTSGRNLLTFEQRLVLEEYYIDNPSLIMDFKILLKTIPVVLSTKGAF